MREGPLWIVLPPLSTDERMSVNDPDVHDCEQRPWVTGYEGITDKAAA